MAEKETPAKAGFTKEQLLTSKKYAARRDLLTVLLEDGKQYTHDEVEKRIKGFMERKVR